MDDMHLPMGEGGEFDIIRGLLRTWGDTASGIGSDVALLEARQRGRVVVSTDSSVEGVHFRREWLTPEEIGYRATGAALSDLAAAGASPAGLLVAMTVPDDWREQLHAVARGIGGAASSAGTKIIGGDTSRGAQFTLTLTVLGIAERPLTRTGARPGDRLLLTGDIGRSGAALEKLLRGVLPSESERARFAHPVPRIGEGAWLSLHGATAAIDVSDGLASELRHLAAASGVHIRVDRELLPVSAGIDAMHALASGEEYELLFTAGEKLNLDDFRSRFDTPVTEIGVVLEGDAHVELRSRGVLIDLPAGYSHF